MTLPAPTYDLVLLLDPETEAGTRAKILADTRASIEAQGEFLRHDEWGDRTLTYPIDRKAVAEYHLLQFHAGALELLDVLDRTLRITDGVLRFRIIKLKPGVPDAPTMPSAPGAERAGEPQAAVETTVEVEDRVEVEPDAGAELEADVEVGEPA
jgi:small subunit ribosomal protein S6